MSTDDEWEDWGLRDPYYGVLTDDKLRRRNLTDEALDQFFRSGKDDIEHLLHIASTRIDPAFTPQRALNFGCGVGRLLIPLAGIAEEVVGLDVSESMLKEARKNC